MLHGERPPPELDYTNDVPRLPTRREMVQDGRGLCSALEFDAQRISSTISRTARNRMLPKGEAAPTCANPQDDLHMFLSTCVEMWSA